MSASHYNNEQKLYWDPICTEFKEKLRKKSDLGTS